MTINITRKKKQVFSLYLSMILNIILGMIISILTTRYLGPKEYGIFQYLVNLLSIIPILFTLGVFIATQKLVAHQKYDSLRKEFLGAVLVYTLVSSIIMSIILCGYSFFDDIFYKNNLGYVIRILSPWVIVYQLQACLENYLAGDNKIQTLSLNRTGPKLSFLFLLFLIITFSTKKLDAFYFNIIQLFGMMIIYVYTIIKLKPQFNNLKNSFSIIFHEVKVYGIHEYTGTLFDVFTDKIASFSILYFLTSKEVGFYSLSCTVAAPLSLISGVVGTTLYKDFANSKILPSKPTKVTVALSIISLIAFLLVIGKVFILFYSKAYSNVINLTYVTAFAFTLWGIADYINRFMGSHGFGKEMRNAAFLIGISNVLGFTGLVFLFGVMGAAMTKLLASLIYLLSMVYYYFKKKAIILQGT
jgi:O-antigen/teichoic acid export membrane protein